MENERRIKSNICAIAHCRARQEDGVTFCAIPKAEDGKDGGQDLLAVLKARRRALWETALGKVVDMRVKNQIICSRHFIKGKKAHVLESSNPDWVPTLNLEPVKPESGGNAQAASHLIVEALPLQTNRKMNNYEVYALIEGRIKLSHKFRYKAIRENGWRSVQSNCAPVLNCFTVEQLEQKWAKLCRLYQKLSGPRDPKLDYYPAEEWVHYSKMHDAMERIRNQGQSLTDQTEEAAEVPEEDEEETCCEVDDYYRSGTDKILWGKGAENRPKPNRAALMASKPPPKRPINYGTRTCKAVQSGNPGLQPTARPVPPPGSPDYCRLCFTNQQLEPLCSGVIVVRDELLEKIYVCTGVLIIARPKESIYICVPCAALINNFSTFRQQICSNNRALIEQLNSRKPPEMQYTEPPPPLVGTAVSSVLPQSHIVRGPAPKKIILTPPNKGVPLKTRTNTLSARAPQQVGTPPRLPTLTRAPNAPVIVKRIVYAKPGAVPVGLPPSRPIDEAAMELPEEEIKTEFDDPLDGCGDSGNALVMPKPLKPPASATSAPTTLKMRVESHPEPVVPAVIDGNESWKCCYCEQDLPFKFELAKHLLQVHKEGVAAIRERLDLDELNTNMLEMMALRAGSSMGRKVVVIQAPAKRPRMDTGEVVEIE